MKANLSKIYREGYTTFPNLIMCDDRISCQGKMVAIVLWFHGFLKESCFPSQKLIAQEAGVSIRTVRNQIKKLKELGYIDYGKSSRYYTYTLFLNRESKLNRLRRKTDEQIWNDKITESLKIIQTL